MQADAHELVLDQIFDVIILSDLINDLWNVQTVFEHFRMQCHPRTRIIMNFYSRMWEFPLRIAEQLGLAKPTLQQNWLDVNDVGNLLYLSGYEMMRNWAEVLWPVNTPLVESICNRFLVKLIPFRALALTNFVVARPMPKEEPEGPSPRISIVVPARNEAGNIEQLIDRVPEIGGGTEIIFVEGHSTDDTYAAIEQAISRHPERSCKLLKQTGKGKGDAVRCGFAAATGDILTILDADLTVPPEDLPVFFDVLRSGMRRFRQRRSSGLSARRQRHAHGQPDRQQILRLCIFLDPRPAHQGHALRHQNDLEEGLRPSRRQPGLFRRFRSVR